MKLFKSTADAAACVGILGIVVFVTYLIVTAPPLPEPSRYVVQCYVMGQPSMAGVVDAVHGDGGALNIRSEGTLVYYNMLPGEECYWREQLPKSPDTGGK